MNHDCIVYVAMSKYLDELILGGFQDTPLYHTVLKIKNDYSDKIKGCENVR